MKTVEDIVKAKHYFELTPDELVLVSEVAEDEDAYERLQYLLLNTDQYFEKNKVMASEGMRDHIMEKLYPPVTSSIAWYKSIWIFFFPPNKLFYQYPSFQLVAILLVFVGVFTVLKNPIQQNNLAVNQLQEKELVEESKILSPTIDSIDQLSTEGIPALAKENIKKQPSQPKVEESADEEKGVTEIQTETLMPQRKVPATEHNFSSEPSLNTVNSFTVVNEDIKLMDDISANELKEEVLETDKVVTQSLSNDVPAKALETAAYSTIEVKKQSRFKTDLTIKKVPTSISVIEVKNIKELFFEVK